MRGKGSVNMRVIAGQRFAFCLAIYIIVSRYRATISKKT
jgi:hypothetical protein